MHAQITNFRGLADLRAAVAPILLLAGANGAGKSSGCSAIAAAASGMLLPFEGVTKGKAGLLVRDGADLATAHLDSGDGSATVSWPAVERMTAGSWRDISAVAAGLVDVASARPADRAALLIDLIGAIPTADDLRAAMAEAKAPQAMTDEAVKRIAGGWDAAHAFFKEGGTKLKGKWEQVTGARYGKAKVIGWRPAGWQPYMEGLTLEAAAEEIAAAEQAVQEATKNAGASQSLIDAWQALADTVGQREHELKAAATDHTNEAARAQQLSANLGPKPEPGAEPLMCPCCDAGVRLKDGKLVAADPHDFAELSQALTLWEAASRTAAKAIERRDIALRHFQAAERKLEEARAAQVLLDEARTAGKTGTEDAIEEASQALAIAVATADMRRRVNEATELADKIQHAADVTELLDKTGLRQAKLVDALGDFNGQVVQVCKSAGWSPVHVDADMGVTYGGRPLSLCSAGEQYRARISLQLAIAGYEKAALVVIDGADILDKAGRNGLFRALDDLGFKAIIGMTLLRRDEMPDLARAGLGESVWIEAGRPAAAVREAA